MSAERPLLPVACSLGAGAGAEQLVAWQAFNDDYLLDSDVDAGSITAHYARVDDATTRLAELVRTEQTCCAFASWAIDSTQSDLRLTVTGTPEALQALTFLPRP